MAHAIKLKYGSPAGWSYIDLTDANHGNVSYVPGTPEKGAVDIIESGTFRVAGSSVADLIAKIAGIEQVFYRAGAYDDDQVGAYKVRLTLQPEGVAETWESEILDGRLELTENIFGVDWANKSTDVVLIWRRAGFWERSVPLSTHNSNGSGLGGVIYNRGDGSGSVPTKKENWFDIDAASLPCDLPSPAVITFAPNVSLTDFVVFMNAKTSPTVNGLAEGETGTGDTVDANRSGGKYKNYPTPVGGTTGIDVSKAATGLDAVVEGAWLRFMLSASFIGTVYARPYFEFGGKRYYGTRSVLTGAGAFHNYDLGMARLPAISSDAYILNPPSGLNELTVGINFIAATAIVVSVDYFHYIPIDAYARGVLDAGADKMVIMDSRSNVMLGNLNYGSSYKITSIGTLYGGIWLEPNMLHRLTFKMTNGTLDDLSNYANIWITAWLRKRTL